MVTQAGTSVQQKHSPAENTRSQPVRRGACARPCKLLSNQETTTCEDWEIIHGGMGTSHRKDAIVAEHNYPRFA